MPVSSPEDALIEFSPHGRLPRLDLGIDWESPWREFRSSARHAVLGQRAPKNHELPADSDLRVHWIEGKNSPWAFAASSLWHAIAITLLVLPIWGFLPATAHNLAPPDIEVSWTAPQDLPPIHLEAPILTAAKPEPRTSARAIPKIEEERPPAPKGADAFHPRQTILSIPVRITHPRQTLIEPKVPMAPPKIDPQLPNLVQWAADTPAPTPELQLAPSNAAPTMRERKVSSAAAPDIANLEKTPGPLNISSSPVVNPAPQMPMTPMSASTAEFRERRMDGAAAPQLNETAGDSSLRDVVALSASPAPPAPVVEVPRGNLAARVAISPAGAHRGDAGGASSSSGRGAPARGAAGNGSLPVSVSVSGGNGRAVASGGGIGASHAPTRLLLKPMYSLPEPPPMNPRKGPANVGSLAPGQRPEDLFAGKEVHSLNIDLPNVTSMSGNWVLNFAQLDEGTSPFDRPTGVLNGPVPYVKVDPKYPAEAIRQNIEGEVVLYAIIRANGSVDSIQVVRHLDPLLDREAVAALAQWKFRPATRNGKPVDVEAIVHIPFNYKPPEQ
jgi:TonB family protein